MILAKRYRVRSFQFNTNKYEVKINKEFGFKDSSGVMWTVPEGWLSTGAVIPRSAWNLIGSPLTGEHTASVILYDYYSTTKTRPWEDVNKMFRESLINSPVNNSRAMTFYYEVYTHGSRWRVNPSDIK